MRNHPTRPLVSPAGTEDRKLPLPALLALATAVFITSLTETLPAEHWVVGAHINRRLRRLTAATVLFAAAATILALSADSPALVYIAVTLWGLGWGGIPTLLQTAATDAGGDAADTAQAMLVTLWNVAMAGGGVAGGILLDLLGSASLPWSALVLLVPVLAVVVGARAHGFPARCASTTSAHDGPSPR